MVLGGTLSLRPDFIGFGLPHHGRGVLIGPPVGR